MEAGACGITVAKLSEAAVMLEAGIRSIHITSPIVQPCKAAFAMTLIHRFRGNLIFTIDSLSNAMLLSSAAYTSGVPAIDVIFEVDCGQERTGASVASAPTLAAAAACLPCIRLVGIQRYCGHLQHLTDTAARTAAARDYMEGGAAIFRKLAGVTVAFRTHPASYYPIALRPTDADTDPRAVTALRVAASAALTAAIPTPNAADHQKYASWTAECAMRCPPSDVSLAANLGSVVTFTGGGTGTFLGDLDGPLTELQPGSYCLLDEDYRLAGGLPRLPYVADPPLTMLATVLGTPPTVRPGVPKAQATQKAAAAVGDGDGTTADGAVGGARLTPPHCAVGCVDAGLKAMYKDGPPARPIRLWRTGGFHVVPHAVELHRLVVPMGEADAASVQSPAAGTAATPVPLSGTYEWRGDEHGVVVLTYAPGVDCDEEIHAIAAGDTVELVVSHVDPTVAQHDFIFLVRDNDVLPGKAATAMSHLPIVTDIVAVDARGCHW